KNNVFGGTAFIAYGFFWCAMAFSWAVSSGMLGELPAAAFDASQTGVAFVAYFILTVFMTIGALRTTKVLFFIFLAIDFLFLGLSLSAFGVAPEVAHMLAAVSELIISLLSFYGAGANVLNHHFGEPFLPLGKAFWTKG
ncbi:MAG: acetate uptake transporter, partial [Raoultibacter sp.]